MLCRRGLHGCRTAMQALHYASGDVICRVRLSGEIREDNDKLAASRREVLWLADAGAALHRFAVWCAEASLARMETRVTVDPRLREALAVKLRWVEGLASEDDLAVAWAAAREVDRDAAKAPAWMEAIDAPWEAARSAAWLSAWDIAWIDTGAAVRGAAWNAAKGGSWGPAGEAAWEAAWNAGEAGSERDVAWDPVRDEAWATAWDAVRAAQSAELERRLLALASPPSEYTTEAAFNS
ncbi:MAG TPA: hypothetical protein VHZ03_34105 [Trebonia sp.]|nr:hypothetical protein [Trebonia sp.]